MFEKNLMPDVVGPSMDATVGFSESCYVSRLLSIYFGPPLPLLCHVNVSWPGIHH